MEIIRAILKLPVDLLWNGGIGTYVKASWEANSAVGDRTNDAVRVDGRDLRCKVVGEGGNLGCSQLGRIEYALHGGRLNTDFVDNSGGVDCSDHEVNIKILLKAVQERTRMTTAERNRLLESMTEDVGAARAARQLPAEPGDQPAAGGRAGAARRARALHPLARTRRRARPRARVPAERARRSRTAAARGWAWCGRNSRCC